MNRYILILILLLVGCSATTVPIGEIYTEIVNKKTSASEIDISTGEVERYIDSNGFFYIRGPFPEEKQRWLRFTVWVLRYDTDMPRQCVGHISQKYMTLFHELDSALSDEDIYKPVIEDDELIIVNHEVSYRLRAKTALGIIFSDYLQISIDKSKRSEIVDKTVDYFDSLGLNPFDWRPKKHVFKNIVCT